MGRDLNKDKRVLNSELFQEVSFSVDDRHQVHQILKKKKAHHRIFTNWRKALAPVIIAITLLFAANYFSLNPVLALSKLPFFESIFQFLGDSGLKGATTEEKQAIQQQKKENGINMEIQEAVYDGKRLSISYAIKSDKPIKNYASRMVDAYIPINGIQKAVIFSSDQFKQISDYEVIGYSTFTNTAAEIRDEMKVDLLYKGTTDFFSAKEKEFKFLFEIPIKKTSKIDTVAINKKQTYGEEELKLQKISVSPISTVFNLQYKIPYKNNQETESLSIRLLDQDNRVIKEVAKGFGWAGTQIKQENRWYSLQEANLLFEPLDEQIKELKIQLFKNKNIVNSTTMQEKFISLNEGKNQILDLGERGTMKITTIEQEAGSAVIRYEYKSKFAFYNNLSPLVLERADGTSFRGIEKERKYLGNETYMVEELFLDLPDEELAVRYVQEKAPNLIEELEIKVSADEIRNGSKVK